MKSILKNQYSIAILFWSIIFGTYLLYPGKSDPFQMTGFFLSFFFCILALIPGFFIPAKLEFSAFDLSLSNLQLKKIINIFFITSILGILFHLWDKIGLRHYNYLSCNDIREQWLNDGANRRNSISSWQSALGHIFIYFSIVPVIFSNFKVKREKFLFILSCLIFVIYCWTIVSRSSLLAFSVICVASFHHFFVIGKLSAKEFFQKTLTLFIILFLFIFLSFFKKISCTNQDSISTFTAGSMKEHRLSFEISNVEPKILNQFEIENKILDPAFKKIKTTLELPAEWFKGNQHTSYVLNAIPLYMGNGINNFSQVTNVNPNHDYKFIYNPLINAFNRILGKNFIELSNLRDSFGQGFINFIGAIYLTYGKWGVYLFPLILGAILRVLYILSSKNYLIIPFASFLQSFLILAPLTNLTSNMSTPFLFFATVMLLLYTLLIKFMEKK